MKIITIAAALLLTLSGLGVPPAQAQPPLFRVVEVTAPDVDAQRDARIQVDLALLLQEPARLLLQLPSGATVARRVSSERTVEGVTWIGRLDGGLGSTMPGEGSDVVLTAHRGLLIGRIYTADQAYAIQPTSDTGVAHSLGAIDSSTAVRGSGSAGASAAPAPCGGGLEVDRPFALESPSIDDLQSIDAAAGSPRVDIMIAFTSRARAELGNNRIEAEARAAVSFFNASLDNSGVAGSGRLVGTVVAPQFDGYRSHGDALRALRQDSTIAAQRDAANADVVVLYLASGDSTDACGLGYLLQRGDSANTMAPFAFSTVNVGCDIGSVTTHEIGHNLGLQHDPQNAGGSRIYAPDAHGHYFAQGANFKTIMAYSPFTEIPYFSTPDLQFRDRPMGILGERHNARVLGETMSIGSRYRRGGGGNPNDGDPSIAPSDLTALDVGPDRVLLSWVDNADEEVVVLVEQRRSGAGWRQIGELPPNTVEYLVTGLERLTAYDFRVRVRTTDEVSTYSNRLTITTLGGPGKPELFDAEPISSTSVRLHFAGIAPGDLVRVEQRSLDSLPDVWQVAAEVPEDGDGSLLVSDLVPGQPYTFRVLAISAGLSSEPSDVRSATPLDPAIGACQADEQTLCLRSGRFELQAHWNDPFNPPLSGRAGVVSVPGSDETGMFWFFDPQNIELVSKVLDGRALNQRFWNFYGALSDVEYWLTVRDTVTGTAETYHNEPFSLCGASDIDTFEDTVPAQRIDASSSPQLSTRVALPFSSSPQLGSASGQQEAGACIEDGDRLCLGDGRFSVTVDWVAPDGNSGIGRPVAGTATRDSGFLWFFEPSNLELAVKILDGRPFNGKFWFYWGGLSDVSYTINILDTVTNQSTSYSSAAGALCGGADVEALDG